MYNTQEKIVEICKQRNIRIYDIVLEEELKDPEKRKNHIIDELLKMVEVMEEACNKTLQKPYRTNTGMIDGFAKMMIDYSNSQDTITGTSMIEAMAMAFSTLETSASMGKIVASPTAGSSGILPAALMMMKKKKNLSHLELTKAMLTAVGVGQVIGKYACFSGAEGGCQAECGSAAAMSAAALVELSGGTVEMCLHAASISLVNILGLVCDPIAGFVEYPCTFRNASGVMNAMISADMALAGVRSIVPFEEVVQAMGEVGRTLPAALRETGIGGLAGTKTGREIREKYLERS